MSKDGRTNTLSVISCRHHAKKLGLGENTTWAEILEFKSTEQQAMHQGTSTSQELNLGGQQEPKKALRDMRRTEKSTWADVINHNIPAL